MKDVIRAGKNACLISRSLLLLAMVGVAYCVPGSAASMAQTAPAAAKVIGTVKSINGNTIEIAPDSGASQTVTVADNARVQQSADMKTVTPSTLDKLAVGDRVLATGVAGEGGALTATRLVMIKAEAIAQRNQSSQQDWARRGSGGIVNSTDPANKTVSIKVGQRDVAITTTDQTLYKRYAPGSVKYDDAKKGAFGDIQKGDQLRVRGDKSPDGATITADEIVSGTFKNLAGTVVSINVAAGTLVIKDLSSKKNENVIVGANSDLRAMPPEIAARFSAAHGGGAGRTAAAGGAAGTAPAGAGQGAGRAAGETGAEGGRPAGAGGAGHPGGRAGAGDLSQVIPRLPKANLADIKPGEALMIVSSGAGSSGPFTVITLLTGVEPLLTGPAGSELTIPPWSSTGGGEGGGTPE